MVDKDVLVTWNAETGDFVDNVLTANQVLKENERKLKGASKAATAAKQPQQSLGQSFGKLAAIGATVFATYESLRFVFENYTEAMNNAADAARNAATAQSELIGRESGLLAGIGAAEISGAASLASSGREAAITQAAQSRRLQQFDEAIAGGNVGEKLLFTVGKVLEQGRQAIGLGGEGEIAEGIRESVRLNEQANEEFRRFNETQAVVRDTD